MFWLYLKFIMYTGSIREWVFYKGSMVTDTLIIYITDIWYCVLMHGKHSDTWTYGSKTTEDWFIYGAIWILDGLCGKWRENLLSKVSTVCQEDVQQMIVFAVPSSRYGAIKYTPSDYELSCWINFVFSILIVRLIRILVGYAEIMYPTLIQEWFSL